VTPSSTSTPTLPPCLHNNQTQVTIVEVKDLRRSVAIEISKGIQLLGWNGKKYSVYTLKKSNCYTCTTGRLESQVVPFSLRWSSDPDGMDCMLALLQDAKAQGNKSYQTLSLLFPEVRGPAGQPLRTIRPPALDINYTSSHQTEGQLTNVGNLTGCSESRSFNSLTNQSTLAVGRADVWWYCRGPLLESLPGKWAGTCALVQLAIPFTLASRSPARATTSRKRRDIGIDTALHRL
jgi:hypothetical protein